MFIRKKNRKVILEHLFQQGVLWAPKDFNLPKHPDIKVPTLEVIKLMQSLKSKDFVTEKFSWQVLYWRLTDSGVTHLRELLHLPNSVAPDTLTQANTGPGGAAGGNFGAGGRGGPRGGGGRGGGGWGQPPALGDASAPPAMGRGAGRGFGRGMNMG